MPSTLDPSKKSSRWRSTLVGPLAPVEVSDETALPEMAQRYTEHDVLGVGGMGEVKLVRDERIGRDVAQKTLRRDVAAMPEWRQRFIREAHIQGQIEHPSVVPVYDLAETPGGEPYFTMRRVMGQTLAEIIEGLGGDGSDGTIDPSVARWTRRKLLDVFSRVCLAVHFAHVRGVVHRDLKPENIMLGEFGELYLLDWGAAKVIKNVPGARGGEELTEPGNVVGTPLYMSPEQILASGSLDVRSDIYSLGCILYEILTCQPLKSGESLGDLAAQTIAGFDARASLRTPDVAPGLDAICQRAVETDAALRYQTARALSDALERVLDEPAQRSPAASSTAERTPPSERTLAPASHAAAAPAPQRREQTSKVWFAGVAVLAAAAGFLLAAALHMKL